MVEIQGVDPRMIANNIEPYEPTHPGELLKDELEYPKLTQKQVARDMGVSYTVLNDIIRGKRPVNTKFALLCEQALNIPAEMLLRMQSEYDLLTTRRDKSFAQRLAQVRKIAAVL